MACGCKSHKNEQNVSKGEKKNKFKTLLTGLNFLGKKTDVVEVNNVSDNVKIEKK